MNSGPHSSALKAHLLCVIQRDTADYNFQGCRCFSFLFVRARLDSGRLLEFLFEITNIPYHARQVYTMTS